MLLKFFIAALATASTINAQSGTCATGTEMVGYTCLPCCLPTAIRNGNNGCCLPGQLVENGYCCDPEISPAINPYGAATPTPAYDPSTNSTSPSTTTSTPSNYQPTQSVDNYGPGPIYGVSAKAYSAQNSKAHGVVVVSGLAVMAGAIMFL